MTPLMLTVWQKKSGLHPTRAGEESLESPNSEAFGAAVVRLLETVGAEASPFQIVVQMGYSSRGIQLDQGWSRSQVTSELWAGYLSLAHVIG